MRESRTKLAIRNSTVSFVTNILNVFLSFAVRTCLIKVLGSEYTGIDGLFNNILSFLSLAELGFGTSLVFSMYKPMAEGDSEKLNVLLKLYGRIYTIIGVCVLTIGVSLTPFLDFFIHGTANNVNHLELIYALYVLNSSLSYFFVYKSSLIIVAQDNYIVTLNTFLFRCIQSILQIVALLLTHNFIVFYTIRVVCTLASNYTISQIAKRRFPYIREKPKVSLSREEKKEILKNSYALFAHKIGTAVVYGTDNLLISRFVSVTAVGLYSNYSLLVSAVEGLLNSIFSSLTSSVGNVGATEDAKVSFTIYKRVRFINYLFAGICSSCLFCLLNPFIRLWLGESFLLPQHTTALIVISFYLTFCRRATLIFNHAFGLFWYDRYKPFAEAAVNLLSSIILGKIWNINGVFMGTIISCLCVTFWFEPYVLYKYAFKRTPTEYFTFAGKLSAVLGCGIICTYFLLKQINFTSIIIFPIQMIAAVIVPLSFIIIIYRKNDEFQFTLHLVNKYLYIIKNKFNRK